MSSGSGLRRHFVACVPGCLAALILLFLWYGTCILSDNSTYEISFPIEQSAGGERPQALRKFRYPENNEQSALQFSDDLQQSPVSSNDVLLVNAWVGSGMPSYFPQFLETVKRHPSISFLLVSTYDTPEFCPLDRSESMFFPSSNPNIRVHCSSTTDLIQQSAQALCKEWNCSARQLQAVSQHLNDYVSVDGQAWNNLKPLYATMFRRQFHTLFPHRSFSHWIRIDLDMLLGDWTSLFPPLLLHYDVFTFFPGKSMDWQYIYLKGYIAGFRMSHKIDTLWRSMSIFRNPAAFINTFNVDTYGGQDNTMAADEGKQTVNTLEDHPEVSFIVEPGLLAVDFDVGAHRDRKIVYYGHKADILEVSLYSSKMSIDRMRRHSLHDHLQNNHPAVKDLGIIRLSHNCDMSWLQTQDRLCAASTVGSRQRHQLDASSQIRITREPGSSVVKAYRLPELDHDRDRQVLVYHFQTSKHRGIQYRLLRPTDRVEVGKDWESYWYLKTYDQMGRMSLQKSIEFFPGDWE